MPVARGIRTDVVVRKYDGKTVVWALLNDYKYNSQEDLEFFAKSKMARPVQWVSVFVGTPEEVTNFLKR
jgi:hypothetical protein